MQIKNQHNSSMQNSYGELVLFCLSHPLIKYQSSGTIEILKSDPRNSHSIVAIKIVLPAIPGYDGPSSESLLKAAKRSSRSM
jgi:hypothetical protein